MGSESRSCTKDAVFETYDLGTFPWKHLIKGKGCRGKCRGSPFIRHHQPPGASQNDTPSKCPPLGAEADHWHVLFKYFKNRHISDHVLCSFFYCFLMNQDLISELLKQTQRPVWHLQAFIEPCVIMLALSQKT